MAVFGVRLSDSEELDRFINRTRENLIGDNLVRNPFVGDIKKVNGVYIFNMKPIYPNFTMFGWVTLAITYFFKGFTWWFLPSIILISLGVFWTPHFFYFFFKQGLKHDKIFVKTKMLIGNELIKEVFFNGTKRSI